MKKCVVIYNPISGKGIVNKYIDRIERIVNNYFDNSTIMKTESIGHATKIIKSLDNNVDLVISIGGDGTFNEVMNGNLQREQKLTLSHLPVGTTNDLGAMFGYKKDLITNLKLLLNGTIKKVDICSVNNRAFVYVAGLGKFVNIAYETPQNLKNKLGHVAYTLFIIKNLFTKMKTYDITYTIDNKKYRGKYSIMIISNANRIAGINHFYKDVKLNDNKFEVLVVSMTKIKDLFKGFYYLKTGSLDKVAGIDIYKTDKMEIHFNGNKDIAWCVDGEKYQSEDKNFKIEIIKDIKIQMPNTKTEDLFL